MKHRSVLILALITLCTVDCFGQSKDVQNEISLKLQQFKSESPDVRLKALRELQTSLDPRISGACLPLLRDEGNSIRRLAARAIGSRYQQIPLTEMEPFLKALEINRASARTEEKNMANRAIGLLSQKFANNDMFALSANQRWVIYERHSLPCLIDTHNKSEELLGWKAEGYDLFMPNMSNDVVAPSVSWHPKLEIATMDVLESRYSTGLWIWKHNMGLTKLTLKTFSKLLPVDTAGRDSSIHFQEWADSELIVRVRFVTDNWLKEIDSKVAWNYSTGKLRLVSSKESGYSG